MLPVVWTAQMSWQTPFKVFGKIDATKYFLNTKMNDDAYLGSYLNRNFLAGQLEVNGIPCGFPTVSTGSIQLYDKLYCVRGLQFYSAIQNVEWNCRQYCSLLYAFLFSAVQEFTIRLNNSWKMTDNKATHSRKQDWSSVKSINYTFPLYVKSIRSTQA